MVQSFGDPKKQLQKSETASVKPEEQQAEQPAAATVQMVDVKFGDGIWYRGYVIRKQSKTNSYLGEKYLVRSDELPNCLSSEIASGNHP